MCSSIIDNINIADGKTSGLKSVNKYGVGIVQTTLTDLWDRADATPTQQIWTPPTQARIHQIKSTSTNDDGNPEGSGSGAQAIRIWGLKSWDSKEVYEDIILNGTANVPTVNAYVIIHRMKVIRLGSTYNINAGNITAIADTDGTTTAQISIGKGQTNMAIYGIPSVQNAFFTCIHYNAHQTATPATAVEVDFDLVVNENPDLNLSVFVNKSNIGLRTTGNTHTDRCYEPYFKIQGPAIIKIQAKSTANDVESASEFDLILKDI